MSKPLPDMGRRRTYVQVAWLLGCSDKTDEDGMEDTSIHRCENKEKVS